MDELTEAQRIVDGTVTEWPDVRAKPTFGHRGYVHNGKMFGFLAENGAAVKVLAGPDTDALYAREGVVAFAYNGMPMRAWPILPLRSDAETEFALTQLHAAYERAVAT